MKVPDFIREVVWSCYPPRYKQLSEKPFKQSLKYMSRILLWAFLIAGVLLLPKLFLLKGAINDELSKFDVFVFSSNISQSAPVAVPRTNPWVVVDLNSNLTLTKEVFVIDSETVKYRFFGVKSLPHQQLKDISSNRGRVSGFLAVVLFLMLPGIAILFYIRTWLKYFLLIVVFGTFFFIIMELTKFRLRWKQVLNIAAHALTAIIFIEVISAVFTTVYLIPVLRFLGVNIYAVTTVLFAVFMVAGIVGCNVEARRRR